MTPDNFCYWLQGFFEISNNGTNNLSQTQIEIIKDHLDLVMNKLKEEKPQGTITITGIPTFDFDRDTQLICESRPNKTQTVDETDIFKADATNTISPEVLEILLKKTDKIEKNDPMLNCRPRKTRSPYDPYRQRRYC